MWLATCAFHKYSDVALSEYREACANTTGEARRCALLPRALTLAREDSPHMSVKFRLGQLRPRVGWLA